MEAVRRQHESRHDCVATQANVRELRVYLVENKTSDPEAYQQLLAIADYRPVPLEPEQFVNRVRPGMLGYGVAYLRCRDRDSAQWPTYTSRVSHFVYWIRRLGSHPCAYAVFQAKANGVSTQLLRHSYTVFVILNPIYPGLPRTATK